MSKQLRSISLGLVVVLGITASIATIAAELSERELAALVLVILGGADLESDSDGDGIPDIEDAFPDDPKEDKDSDRDGIGDNSDVFPYDPKEDRDSDRDGIGDNSDVFPYDPTQSNSVVINFTDGNVSSVALNTDAVSLGSGNARLNGASKAGGAGDNTNIIAYDEGGNEVVDAVETSDTLFVAESVLSPDGEALFWLTSPHLQRALDLPQEVCSLYRVTLSSEAVDCLISAAGDVQPKILNSRAIHSASRKGIDFRADGAAVLYALNYERPLPEGISGGTQSGYAWFMSPNGELTGIDPTENFFIWDALWLDDTKIALLEWEYFELGGDEQYWRIVDTITQSDAPESPITANDTSSAARGPLGLMVPGEVVTKTNLAVLNRESEQRVIEDNRGNFFGLGEGYFRQIDTNGTNYTGLEIEAVETGADYPNWSKQSGTGTDVKYSQVSSDDTFFAHTKGLLPRTPISSIEGQDWENGPLEVNYDEGNITVNFGSSATDTWWGIFAEEPIEVDVAINYKVSTGEDAYEDRTLTIPADTINAWLAYDGEEPPRCYANMETCLTWANPEPFEEGFCLHKYGTDPSQDSCVQLNQTNNPSLAYKVLRTDMESQRQKRFDDAVVYPNQSGSAFPGVQTIALIDGRIQAYFKDSRDHKYYLAVADANSFWATGEAALLFAEAQNGAGDNVIITEATSLKLPSPLALDGVAVSADKGGDTVSVSITLPDITDTQGYEFNLFADTPVVTVSPLDSSTVLTQKTGPVISAPNTLTAEYSAVDLVPGDIYIAEMPEHFLVNGSVRRRAAGSQLLFVAP